LNTRTCFRTLIHIPNHFCSPLSISTQFHALTKPVSHLRAPGHVPKLPHMLLDLRSRF
jgi:hypothetical protein